MKTVYPWHKDPRRSACLSGISMVLLLLLTACGNVRSTAAIPVSYVTSPVNGLTLVAKEGSVSVWASQADRETGQDILAVMRNDSAQVCEALQTACQFDVIVEVYPDQASFDEHAMNLEMRGYFAISGNGHTIQMVSPANPYPHKVSYEDGISVVVHEYVHLAIDEINPELPVWLDEGTAIYIGPHKPYTTVCEIAFPFEMTPTFGQLRDDYYSVESPDLFAYTVIDFIVHQYGMAKLNMLLETPQNLNEVLGVSQAIFEDQWSEFMQTQYHSYKP